jgi:hypothetical protein
MRSLGSHQISAGISSDRRHPGGYRSGVAVMDAFFSTVKIEIGERCVSHAEAKAELLDYIEVFDNQGLGTFQQAG